MVDNITQLPDPRDNLPHFNYFAMCIACAHRWIATICVDTSLFHLECPKCASTESFASEISEEYTTASKEYFKK